MKTASRLLHILAILGAIGSGMLFYLSENDAAKTQEQLSRANTQLLQERTKAKQVSEKNQELLNELEGKNDALEEARANITVLSSRNTQLKRETQRFTEELEERVSSEEKLQQEITRLDRENAKIKASSVNLNEVQKYTHQITALQEEILQLENTNVRFPGKAVASEDKTPSLPEDLNGKILTVGAKSSFVVLNVGYQNGVRLAHSLSIERGSETIAKIEITEVKEKLSIARILPDSLKSQIKEGDRVSPL